jgi:surface polysaccharide O-acyltransferase-like enzyme
LHRSAGNLPRADRVGLISAPMAGARYFEVDLLKAAAIVTVVLIHSLPAPWDPSTTAVEVWLGNVTRFAVPCFLLTSGFLYATREGVPGSVTAGRVRRIVAPYLVASIAAQIWRLAEGRPSITGGVATDLLFGASLGPFYYVLQIFLLVLLTPAFASLSRLAPALFTALLPLSILVQFAFDQGWILELDIRWYIRNPLVWWCYFLLGWNLRLHYEPISRFVVARRGALVAALSLLVCALALGIAWGPSEQAVRPFTWASAYAIAGLLFALGCGRSVDWAPLRTLSDSSYAIFLFHLFFVAPLAPLLRSPGQFSPLALLLPWLAGMVGSLLLVSAAKRLLGDRSRDWVGA